MTHKTRHRDLNEDDVVNLLAGLSDGERQQLVDTMQKILDATEPAPGGYDAALRQRYADIIAAFG